MIQGLTGTALGFIIGLLFGFIAIQDNKIKHSEEIKTIELEKQRLELENERLRNERDRFKGE